jgi:hypothetical protein
MSYILYTFDMTKKKFGNWKISFFSEFSLEQFLKEFSSLSFILDLKSQFHYYSTKTFFGSGNHETSDRVSDVMECQLENFFALEDCGPAHLTFRYTIPICKSCYLDHTMMTSSSLPFMPSSRIHTPDHVITKTFSLQTQNNKMMDPSNIIVSSDNIFGSHFTAQISLEKNLFNLMEVIVLVQPCN